MHMQTALQGCLFFGNTSLPSAVAGKLDVTAKAQNCYPSPRTEETALHGEQQSCQLLPSCQGLSLGARKRHSGEVCISDAICCTVSRVAYQVFFPEYQRLVQSVQQAIRIASVCTRF